LRIRLVTVSFGGAATAERDGGTGNLAYRLLFRVALLRRVYAALTDDLILVGWPNPLFEFTARVEASRAARATQYVMLAVIFSFYTM